MAYDKIPLSEATEPQLREFADMMGLDVTASTPLPSVRAAISSAWQMDYINVRPAPIADVMVGFPPEAVAGARALDPVAQPHVVHAITGERTQGGTGRDDPRVKLKISTEERDGKTIDDDVNIGVNGVVWQCKRGVELDVPYRVYEALLLTVKTVITNVTEGRESFDVHRDVPAYPFNVMAMPAPEAIAAWRARTDDVVFPA